MTNRHGTIGILTTALFALLILALPAAAQQEGHEGHGDMAGHDEMTDHQEMGDHQEMAGHEMSAEDKAMMEAWAAVASPGPQHERLAKGAGHFKMTVKIWADPSGDPEVSEGTSHREMVLGGRYLVDHTDGSMMGQEFHGVGMTGYDNVKGKYWSTWMDTMGTGLLASEGDVDAEGKLVVTGSYADAMTHQDKHTKIVTWWEGDDTEMMQMFEQRGDDWPKIMEITYKRQ